MPGWVKVNCDGSLLPNSHHAGAAAVLRNDQGQWLVASNRKLMGVDIVLTELWAIKDGLTLA